ncbi:MAG: sensor histidine kinase [Acetobacteraceae bacterium]
MLPDLCSPAATLPLVLLAVLIAAVLAIARSWLAGFWPDFARLALLSAFLTLASAGGLCLLRRALVGRGAILTIALAFVLLVAIAWGIGEAAYFLLGAYGPLPPANRSGRTLWVLRIVIIALIADALVLRYLYVSAEWRERVRREASSRLDALTARIRPHFLFNTLNTAAALVAEQPEAAERTLEDLSELFRANLDERAPRIPLAEEVALARRYLAIEERRLGPRLRAEWRIEADAAKILVPPLLLQPLVENAVTHGIEPSAAGGTIVIIARRIGKHLELRVENSGNSAGDGHGHGIGLAGVRARLGLAYGSEAGLTTRREAGRFVATVLCPGEA